MTKTIVRREAMGYIRRPDYFKNFHCISSKCTDSCCWHWEIDIDEDTLQYYCQVPGAFGERLRKSIMPPDPETDEPAHFISDQRERCPFLNTDNLCDIFLQLGEEHLSYICTHHPRYYDWLLGGQEAGLGLCCEEAARLILQETGYPVFEVTETADDHFSFDDSSSFDDSPYLDDSLSFDGSLSSDDSSPSSTEETPSALPDDAFESDEDLELEQAFEDRLLAMREELFAIVKPGKSSCTRLAGPAAQTNDPDRSKVHGQSKGPNASAVREQSANPAELLDTKLDRLYEAALLMQEECDDWFFPSEVPAAGSGIAQNDRQPASLSEQTPVSWTDRFWQADYLDQLLDGYLRLEINDPAWWKLLRRVKEQLPVLLPRRQEFLIFYQDRLYEYEQLLIYFLYRHFLKAREDLLLTEKVLFALISVSVIQLLDLEHWLACGALPLKEQIGICKLYSKEIEYDEDNTRQVPLFAPDLPDFPQDNQQ